MHGQRETTHRIFIQVMAGSGDLTVLRICRYLRSRIAPPLNYGSHMALAMASGLLLLGGGKLVDES